MTNSILFNGTYSKDKNQSMITSNTESFYINQVEIILAMTIIKNGLTH